MQIMNVQNDTLDIYQHPKVILRHTFAPCTVLLFHNDQSQD
jgi:hypothetical protein